MRVFVIDLSLEVGRDGGNGYEYLTPFVWNTSRDKEEDITQFIS